MFIGSNTCYPGRQNPDNLTLKDAGFWEVFFGEMKFVLSNFLSNEDLSTYYVSVSQKLVILGFSPQIFFSL